MKIKFESVKLFAIVTTSTTTEGKEMKSRTQAEIAQHIRSYAQFMSFEAAVAKVKRNQLNRIDFMIDAAAKSMKGA